MIRDDSAHNNDWHLHLVAKTGVCAIYFDLRKAFDSVAHRPLLHKLENFGITKIILLNWITSYLTESNQRVVLNGDESSSMWLMITFILLQVASCCEWSTKGSCTKVC